MLTQRVMIARANKSVVRSLLALGVAALGAIVLMAMPRTAQAADGQLGVTLSDRAGECESTVCVPGRYRFEYLHLTNFAVNHVGETHNVEDFGRQVWRIRPRINFNDSLFLEFEGDLVTGRVFGDLSSTASDILLVPEDSLDAWTEPKWTDLRQAYISWKSPIGLFKLGHQTSRFGFGMVANDGDDERHDVFDEPNVGDIVERAVFATAPLKPFFDDDFSQHFIIAGGFDVVFRDDNAFIVDGDLAMQGIVSLMYRADWLTAGIYMAFRNQEDNDGDTLDVQAYDIFVKWTHEIESIRARFTLGAELALINGTSTRVRHDQAREGVDVLGFGGVLQSSFTMLDLGLEVRLEAGYASGDNNLNDDQVRSFSFDPGYHVGMILFREVLGRVSARTVEHARDPELQGTPRQGFEQVATDGAINNAVYVNPVIRYKAPFGLTWDLGVLVAWSPADLVNPFTSNLNGGYNYNYLDAEVSSNYLGTEIDAGVGYEINIREALVIDIAVQGGVFFPGGAFDGPDGGATLDTVAKLRTTIGLGW